LAGGENEEGDRKKMVGEGWRRRCRGGAMRLPEEGGIKGWLREREESVTVVAIAAGGRRRKGRKKKKSDGGPAHSGTRAYEKVCGTPSRPTKSEYSSSLTARGVDAC
jgi:hypothetical protein